VRCGSPSRLQTTPSVFTGFIPHSVFPICFAVDFISGDAISSRLCERGRAGYSRTRPAQRSLVHASIKPGAPRTRKRPKTSCTPSRIQCGHTSNAGDSSLARMIDWAPVYAISRTARTTKTTPKRPTQNARQSSEAIGDGASRKRSSRSPKSRSERSLRQTMQITPAFKPSAAGLKAKRSHH